MIALTFLLLSTCLTNPMQPPKELRWGPPKLRRWLNDLLRWTISIQPLGTTDCDVPESPRGRPIFPIARGGGSSGGSSATLGNFQVLPHDETHVRVVWGMIDSVLPTGMTPEDDPVFILEVNSEHSTVCIKVDHDGFGEGATFEVVATAGAPEPTSTQFHYILAGLSWEGDEYEISTHPVGHLSMWFCGFDTVMERV